MKKRTHRTIPQLAIPETTTLLMQPQTVIGLIVILTLVCLGLVLLAGVSLRNFNTQQTNVTGPVPMQTPLQPAIIQLDAKPTPTPTATAAAQLVPAVKIKVKKDQTFWEFASRYCGNHDQAEALAHANGYKSVTDLKADDWVTITCQ